MKTTIAILFILLLFFGYDNIRLRSEIKPFKTVLPESEVISRLKSELFKKDSIMLNCDVYIKNEKDMKRIKQIYFKN